MFYFIMRKVFYGFENKFIYFNMFVCLFVCLLQSAEKDLVDEYFEIPENNAESRLNFLFDHMNASPKESIARKLWARAYSSQNSANAYQHNLHMYAYYNTLRDEALNELRKLK